MLFLTCVLALGLVEMPPEALVEQIKRLEEAQANLDTVIEMRIFDTVPLADVEKAALGDDDWLVFYSIRMLTYDGRIRMETVSRNRGQNGNLTESRAVQVWDGESFLTQWEGETALGVSPKFEYPFAMRALSFFTMNGSDRVPGSVVWSEVIRQAEVVSQSEGESSISHRFVPEEMHERQPAWAEYTLILDKDAGLRPIELSQEVFSVSDDGDPVSRGVETWEIKKWKEFDGVMLPSEAIREVRRKAFPRDGDGVYGLVKFRRLSATRVAEPPDESLFTIEPIMGGAVVDDGMNLAFVVGEPSLLLDGLIYDLEEPLLEHPKDRLGEILASAHARPAVVGGGDLADAERSDVRTMPAVMNRRWAATVVATITGVGVAGALIVARHRKGRSYHASA